MATRILFVVAALTLWVSLGARAQSPDLSGKWSMVLDMSMGVAEPMLELKQGDGGKLTGDYIGSYGTFPLTGTIRNGRIQFSFTMHPNGEAVEMIFTGEISADGQSMKGAANMAQLGEAEWTARRNSAKK